MAYKRRSFSFTTNGSGVGSVTVGLGAKYGRLFQIVIDDSTSAEASVVYKVTDARARVVFESDALDVSEGPFYKQPTTDTSDDTDDNEGTAGYGVPVQGPVVVSCTAGGASLAHSGYLIVEV